MARVEVARLDELVEGKPHPVRLAGREIIVVRWREEVYAVRNICPHQSASFEKALTRPFVGCRRGAASWDFEVDEDTPVVQCPWHKWEFRLTDGYCAADPRFRVRAYETTVEDGAVFVETSKTKAPAA
jgi:nitrite reductase/ring-hydroxylating ferredoxin subunit